MRLQELDNMSETTTENGRRRTGQEAGVHARRTAGRGKSSLRTSGGQNEEKSKKTFGLLAILTTKGAFLVRTMRNLKMIWI
ncbi:MAG: hypothetical protein QM270_08750 [Bacillota bacterium]|nr:hypothetical protein [Bacillota bacterium]